MTGKKEICPRCGGALGDTRVSSRRAATFFICENCAKEEEHFDSLMDADTGVPEGIKLMMRAKEQRWITDGPGAD